MMVIGDLALLSNYELLEDRSVYSDRYWKQITPSWDFLLDPRKQIRSILERVIHYENIAEVMSFIPFRVASETSLNGLDSSPLMQLYKNIDAIDYRQKERVQIIFDHFGLEMYNAFSPYRVSSKIKL
ncbi:hypothetical protein KZP23_08620 [Echinicola marina]|uniref:hypothetical protein n=1 Tax=Echinicola marina TaxID=2859768 RepID=UPI001CF609A1|nr:hypothetical protein [Echinicola marina]UCS95057.1 hypothetical protein KZP23_08620 [Echinicola marina]